MVFQAGPRGLPGQRLTADNRFAQWLATSPAMRANNGTTAGGLGSALAQGLQGFLLGRDARRETDMSSGLTAALLGGGGSEAALQFLQSEEMENNPHAGRAMLPYAMQQAERQSDRDARLAIFGGAPAGGQTPATPARIPPAPTPEPSGGIDYESYLDTLAGLESGHGADVYNDDSGAAGRWQFMPTTWSNSDSDNPGVRERHPELGLPERVEDATPEQERAGALAFTMDNEALFRDAAGFDPHEIDLYASHRLGAGTAIALANAAPNASIYDILLRTMPDLADAAMAQNADLHLGRVVSGRPLTVAELSAQWSRYYPTTVGPAPGVELGPVPAGGAPGGGAPARGLASVPIELQEMFASRDPAVQDLAQALIVQHMQGAERQDPVYDRQTRTWIYPPEHPQGGGPAGSAGPNTPTPEQAELANGMWDDFRRDTQEYGEAVGLFRRVEQSAALRTGAGDVALVIGTQRIIEPQSVVREGEFERARQTGDISERVLAAIGGWTEGQLLTDAQRGQLMDMAGAQFRVWDQQYQSIVSQYERRAQSFGIDPSWVILDRTLADLPVMAGGGGAGAGVGSGFSAAPDYDALPSAASIPLLANGQINTGQLVVDERYRFPDGSVRLWDGSRFGAAE